MNGSRRARKRKKSWCLCRLGFVPSSLKTNNVIYYVVIELHDKCYSSLLCFFYNICMGLFILLMLQIQEDKSFGFVSLVLFLVKNVF